MELYSGVMENEICNLQEKGWNCKILAQVAQTQKQLILSLISSSRHVYLCDSNYEQREGKRPSQREGEGCSITRDIKTEGKCWGWTGTSWGAGERGKKEEKRAAGWGEINKNCPCKRREETCSFLCWLQKWKQPLTYSGRWLTG